jgi:hypothetical protein
MDSIFKTELSGNNGHPSEDELLLYVDGELAPKETNHVRSHLEACWSCRVRTEKIEETISTFIDYRNQVLKPLVEQPPHGWRGFDGRVNRLANEVGRPSVLASLRGTLGRLFSAPTWERGRLLRVVDSRVLLRPIAAIIVVSLVVGLLIYFNRTPVVSASELLQRANDAQQHAISTTTQAVVYQKLQVKRKTIASSTPETITWEVWNDTVNARLRQSVELSGNRQLIDEAIHVKAPLPNRATTLPASLSSLANILRANRMNPAMPLSAASYDTWRRSVAARHDEVTRTKLADGHDAFTLSTASTGQINPSEIIEASLVVRAGDWHPVQERLLVKGNQGDEEFELSETAYSVVSLNTLAPEIFFEQPNVAASPISTPAPVAKKETETALAPVPQPLNPVTATADLEVEVLRLLHEARADLGEQISATRGTDGLLHVTGIVDTAERKAEIRRALQPVMSHPAVRIEIQTVTEAVAEQQQQTIRSKATPAPVTEQKVEINSEVIAAAPELRRHFSSDEQVREFSARMVSQSRSAMRHVYAMKRLMAQFSPEELRTLSPEAKPKWVALIRSHARDYQNEVTALRRELSPIFSPSSAGALASGPEITDDASLARAVEQLFDLASANDGVIRSAFTTSSESSATSAISSPQFWQSLTSAEGLARRIANHP